MPTPEELQTQQELLAAHRRTLAVYLKQRALQGEAYAPPAVENGIRESRQQIRAIKARLRQSGARADDQPDDEETLATSGGAPRRRVARVFGALGTLVSIAGFGMFGYVVVSFIMTIFTLIQSGSSEIPDFGSVFASIPLQWLPIGVGLGFAGGMLIVVGNLVGGEPPLAQHYRS